MSSRISVTADVTDGFGYLGYLSDDAYASLGAMDGIFEPSSPPVTIRPEVRKHSLLWPGVGAALAVTAVSYGLHYLPIAPFQVLQGTDIRRPISSAIIAILVGLLVRNVARLPASVAPGCKRVVRVAIPISIILAAAGLNLTQLGKVGLTALLITAACVLVGVAAGYGSARLLGLRPKLGMLLGAGTGICGNSAIVAVAPLVQAEDEDLLLSIGTVNLMGLVVMLVCPVIGGLLGLSQTSMGVWAGTTVHAVPQAVAAGFTYGPEAGSLATLVKLVRVTLLAPLVFVFAYVSAHRHAGDAANRPHPIVHFARLVPWFVWGFAGLAVLGTLGLVPSLSFPAGPLVDGGAQVSLTAFLKEFGNVLLTMAMGAIGLEVDLRMMIGVSVKALLAGLISSAALMAASLAMIWLLGV